MPSRLDKLFPASFRGIEFFVRTESLSSGGRKIVLHEYPNSDQRFVEDLGELPPIFTMDAFVSGDDWREKAFSLEQELKKAGVGELVMPTFGSVQVHAMPFSKDASQQSIGIISFRLEFATGKPPSTGVVTPTQELVFDAGDKARTGLKEKFANIFKTPEFVRNSIAAIGDLKDAVDEMVDNITDVIDVAAITDFVKQANDFRNQAAAFIADPEGYALNLIQGSSLGTGMWQLTSIGLGVQGAVDSVLNLADFGESLLESESAQTVTGSSIVQTTGDETSSNTPYWPETTQERILRNESRRLTVRTMRINALIVAYEQLAAGSYNTTEEINENRNKVEKVYDNIMLEGTTDTTAIQADSEIRSLIENIRNTSLAVLEQKEQEVFGLTNIDQNYHISQFVLAYNLYAEEFTSSELLTERARVIRGLNPALNGMSMIGNITVLQTEGI